MNKVKSILAAAGARLEENCGGARRRLDGCEAIENVLTIPTSRIYPDENQPRKHFDPKEIAYLAESIRDAGQLQPIRVAYDRESDTYLILAGERRWRAASSVGISTMDCVVDNSDFAQRARVEIQLTENLLRRDLLPTEKARSFQALMDKDNLSGRDLAKRLKISESSVYRAMAVLKMSAEDQVSVDAGHLTIEEVRKRSARKPRGPKTTKWTTMVGDISVTVKCKRLADDVEIMAALDSAIGKLRNARKAA